MFFSKISRLNSSRLRDQGNLLSGFFCSHLHLVFTREQEFHPGEVTKVTLTGVTRKGQKKVDKQEYIDSDCKIL